MYIRKKNSGVLRLRKLIIGAFATVFLLALLTACGEEAEEDGNAEAVEEQVEVEDKIEVPGYTIVEEGDLSIASAERWEYWLVPDDIYISESEIEDMVADALEKAKEDRDFNAVAIWVIDDARQVGNGYTIAKAEYAPEGDWAKAMEVDAGDYDSHELVVDMGSNLSGKIPADYEEGTYPSAEELDVYFHWHNIVYTEASADGEEAVQKTADELVLGYEEADEIISKVSFR